jgi:hypothetical protein
MIKPVKERPTSCKWLKTSFDKVVSLEQHKAQVRASGFQPPKKLTVDWLRMADTKHYTTV